MTTILFFYIVPLLLSMLQIATMISSKKPNAHYVFLKDIYTIQDYFWRKRNVNSFDSFLITYMLVVIVVPGVNWISIVLAAGGDLSHLYLRLKSKARQARFEVFGRESFDGQQVCYTMPMEKHPRRILLEEDFE